MAELELDENRKAILQSTGHVLIEGGPGCGKTTIALLKAKSDLTTLPPEQRVVFLSFSRAAVRQVADRMSGLLRRSDRGAIELRTFHAFFLDLIRSHGRLLTGAPARFITPERESQRRADFSGDWGVEATRLAQEESLFVFDTLAPFAADLLERSQDLRRLLSDRYPLVIVDEFQDTNRDQWRVVQALAEQSTVLCLADPDQRIFDHLDGIDEHRLDDLRQALAPSEFDLSADNHRSPSGGLLDYANAVLRAQPANLPENIIERRYRYEVPEVLAHWAVLAVRNTLAQRLGQQPTIAVLTRVNNLAGRISEALSQEQTTANGTQLPPVDHVLSWDPELTAASALVVASLLEWPHKNRRTAVADTLRQMTDYYRTKLGNGTQGARANIITLERAVAAVEESRTPAAKAAKILLERYDTATDLTGQPVRDWQAARARLAGATELDEVFRQARLLRLLRATDALAWALLGSWDGVEGYRRAADVVRVALAAEAVNVARQDPPLVSVMTMHKSKGKEFDGVVIIEGRHQGPLFSDDPKNHDADRRLLRVAITRAKELVVLVRPAESGLLTPGVFSES